MRRQQDLLGFGGGLKGWMRVQYLKYITLLSCDSNLFTSLHCLLKCLLVISYGVWCQAFFDVVSIALRLTPTRDDSFSGLESLTLIALPCDQKLSPVGQQTVKHDGLFILLSAHGLR